MVVYSDALRKGLVIKVDGIIVVGVKEDENNENGMREISDLLVLKPTS